MPHKKFLHEGNDFKDLIQVVAEEKGILPILVEKDYWLMHCLWALQQNKFKFELKGGTSLSKGFNLIDRFSEDVDIHIDPPKELNVKIGKNQDKPSHIESRKNFYDWITNNLSIPGIISIERDTEFDDSKLRNGGIRLNYNSKFEQSSAIKPFVLLEVGFDVVTPNTPCDISSWAYDFAAIKEANLFDNRALKVPCYLPEYTFIEKLSAILNKFRQQQVEGKMPPNFMRHYYDIFCLLKLDRVRDFIGTPEYLIHKEDRFNNKDALDLTKSEAFLLSDSKIRDLHSSRYKAISDFFYNTPPSFDTILDRIKEVLPKL